MGDAENEENEPKEPKEPKEHYEPFIYLDLDQIQSVIDDAQPLIEVFWAIWTEEKIEQDQVELFTSKGMPGAVGRIIDQIIPPALFNMSPDSFILLVQRAILFGYSLDEIKRRTDMGDTNISTDELEKLWNVTEGDEPTNGIE
tara:strand:- start:83 stop:511 length:429 start_codon:yes stop_codon:yes gene_type:complete